MQRFETRFSGKMTSINVSGIQRAGCRDGMQQAGMMQRSEWDCMDHRNSINQGCKCRGRLQTPAQSTLGCSRASTAAFTLRDEAKGQADLWTLSLPDRAAMILQNVPIISKEKGIIPSSEWLQHHSSVNTRWQKPTSLQWFLAREKLQMQVNYWFFIQAHLSSNENCKCQWVAEIECSISTWGFSAFLDIYSKKAHELTAAFYIITLWLIRKYLLCWK